MRQNPYTMQMKRIMDMIPQAASPPGESFKAKDSEKAITFFEYSLLSNNWMWFVLAFLLGQTLFAQETPTPVSEEMDRWYHSMNLGFSYGNPIAMEEGFESSKGLGFRYAVGYRFHPMAQVGLGTGFSLLELDEPKLYVPAFVEIQGDVLPRRRITPMYKLELGLGYALNVGGYYDFDNKPKGLYLCPQAGYRFKGKGQVFTTVTLGYMLQNATIVDDDSRGDSKRVYEQRWTHQRYVLRFGIGF